MQIEKHAAYEKTDATGKRCTYRNVLQILKRAANKKTNAKRKHCIYTHTTEVLQASRGSAELPPERQMSEREEESYVWRKVGAGTGNTERYVFFIIFLSCFSHVALIFYCIMKVKLIYTADINMLETLSSTRVVYP